MLRRRRHAIHHGRRRRAPGLPPLSAGLPAQRPPHRLVLLKQLTRELAAQEVASGRRSSASSRTSSTTPWRRSPRWRTPAPLARGSPRRARPHERVFTTIGERAAHLASFIDGYARFAKLPRPRPAPVGWSGFLARLEGTTPFRSTDPCPAAGQLRCRPARAGDDQSAEECGGVRLGRRGDRGRGARGRRYGFTIEVADRGSGFTDNMLRDALLPFYSTKPTGTGLGLTSAVRSWRPTGGG